MHDHSSAEELSSEMDNVLIRSSAKATSNYFQVDLFSFVQLERPGASNIVENGLVISIVDVMMLAAILEDMEPEFR